MTECTHKDNVQLLEKDIAVLIKLVQNCCLRMVIGRIEKIFPCRYGTCEPNSATSQESFFNCLTYEVERGSRNKFINTNKFINQKVLVLSC